MGATKSSFKIVENRKGSIPAGKIVRLKSDDTISIASADGSAIGISLGLDLSDTARTPFVREGSGGPVLLTDAFEPTIGAQVAIHNTTGIAATKDGSSTYVNAVYASGVKTALLEDGTEGRCALIDFAGGL